MTLKRAYSSLRVIGFALLCVLSVVTPCAAQTGFFHGQLVHQADGSPVAGASVSVVGASGSTKTDREGRFSWAPVPAPPFQLIIILASGHVVRPALVETVAGDSATIVRVGALADETLTVLGAAPSIDASPAAAATVLSAAQIASRNPEHLTQALETVPGIGQVSEGHAAVPAVRGLARGRTLLLIDGARISAERRVGPSGTFVDPVAVEGIDVARGPGSVAYGSDALGGVISVRTRRGEVDAPLRMRFSGTIGTGVPLTRGSLDISRGLPRGSVLLLAHVRDTGDYDSPDGPVLNSGWKDRGLLANVTHAAGGGVFSTSWQADFVRDAGRPRNNSNVVRFYYPFENSHRVTASYERPSLAGVKQFALTGFWGRSEQRTDQDRFATATTGRSLERADIAADDFQVKARAQHYLGATRLDFGADVNGRYHLEAFDIVQTFDTAGARTRDTSNLSIDARRIASGGHIEVSSPLGPRAQLSGGVRADRVVSRNAGGYFGARDTAVGAASGFGALTIAPLPGLSFTAQIARGFRDPVLSDRYYRGPSGRGFITGNPDLLPESSVQIDVAARYSTARTQVAIYGYQYRITDLIERYQTQTDFFFFRNRGRARLRGVEVEARTEIGQGYSLSLGAHTARGRALDDASALDDVAAPAVFVTGRKAFAVRADAHLRLAWHADDTHPGPSEIAAPGATLLDAGASWQIVPAVKVRGLLRNLLNERYYASPDPRFVLAPGRSTSITIDVQF